MDGSVIFNYYTIHLSRIKCVLCDTTGEKSSAKPPQGGEKRWLKLELKLVADVGLVGVPNAGEKKKKKSMMIWSKKVID